MSNVLRYGRVYVQDILAGEIRETDEGYEFEYDAAYIENGEAKPVSITLPIRSEKYESRYLFPFFDGLIPEGWLLDVTIQNWKIDNKDRFGLMLVACTSSASRCNDIFFCTPGTVSPLLTLCFARFSMTLSSREINGTSLVPKNFFIHFLCHPDSVSLLLFILFPQQ